MSKYNRRRGTYDELRLQHSEWKHITKLIPLNHYPLLQFSGLMRAHSLAAEQLLVDMVRDCAVFKAPTTIKEAMDLYAGMFFRDRMVARSIFSGVILTDPPTIKNTFYKSDEKRRFTLPQRVHGLRSISSPCARCGYWNINYFMRGDGFCITCCIALGCTQVELRTGDLIELEEGLVERGAS